MDSCLRRNDRLKKAIKNRRLGAGCLSATPPYGGVFIRAFQLLSVGFQSLSFSRWTPTSNLLVSFVLIIFPLKGLRPATIAGTKIPVPWFFRSFLQRALLGGFLRAALFIATPFTDVDFFEFLENCEENICNLPEAPLTHRNRGRFLTYFFTHFLLLLSERLSSVAYLPAEALAKVGRRMRLFRMRVCPPKPSKAGTLIPHAVAVLIDI